MIKLEFQKQPMMRKVLVSLAPIVAFALYLYGLKVLFLALVIFPLGIGIEYLFEAFRKKKVSEAAWVTCLLYLLSMPPEVPLWVAAIGIAFAMTVAKGVYGGFGRNPFNPAIAGRLFVYITFPGLMGSTWLTPGKFGIDAASTATALNLMRQGQPPAIMNLLIGIRAGSLGESALLLIVIAAVYLLVTKTASWRIILSTLASFLILTFSLSLAGIPQALAPLAALLSGSFLFVAVFMATDPVSAPKKPGAQWLYGLIIGSVTVLIRTFSLFSEGTSFAILIANTFAGLFDGFFTKGTK